MTDLIPSVREVIVYSVVFISGAFVGAFLLLLGALMSAAGNADDFDEKYRGIRRS